MPNSLISVICETVKSAVYQILVASGRDGAKRSRTRTRTRTIWEVRGWSPVFPSLALALTLTLQLISAKIIARRFDGRMVLSRRDSTIVARHEVPGIMRKIARPSGTIEPILADPNFSTAVPGVSEAAGSPFSTTNLFGTDNDFDRPSGTVRA